MNRLPCRIRILAGLVLAACAATASAATTWSLTNSPANEPAVSGWKASGNAATLSATSVGYWAGAGVGVGGEAVPEHALDNKSGFEAALLRFDKQVNLSSVSVGWSTNDNDLFVLAYVGHDSNPLAGARFGNMGSGWAFVGNYSGTSSIAAYNTLGNPDSGLLYSSFWLIGAGGFQSGVGVTSGDRVGGSWRPLDWRTYDYIKIAAVGGSVRPELPPASVPEPASLILAGVGFLGLVGMRRRRPVA